MSAWQAIEQIVFHAVEDTNQLSLPMEKHLPKSRSESDVKAEFNGPHLRPIFVFKQIQAGVKPSIKPGIKPINCACATGEHPFIRP